MKGVAEGATRVAMLQTGESDVSNLIPGDLLDTIRNDSKLRLAGIKAGPCWLEPMSLDTPDSPLKDIRVRQAISLASTARRSATPRWAAWRHGGQLDSVRLAGRHRAAEAEENIDKAKQLLADAGVANGFEVSKLTPLGGYDSWGERLVTQLRAIGVKTQLNILERAAFYEALAPGEKHIKGFVMQLSGSPGDAAARVRENTLCKGTFSSLCLPDIEEPMKKYDSSTDPAERKKLLDQVQNYLLDQYLLIPILRQALPHAVGPRIANDIKDIEGSIPQYVYLGPYEDVQLKE
jgi:ABC-type transport system substrate-binding protein